MREISRMTCDIHADRILSNIYLMDQMSKAGQPVDVLILAIDGYLKSDIRWMFISYTWIYGHKMNIK